MAKLSTKSTRSVAILACAASATLLGQPRASAADANGGSDGGGSDQLQEIVVTAERRSADVQKIGDSVSVRSGVDLLQQGRTSTTQILEDIPNVSVLQGGATPASTIGADNQGSAIVIRGIPANNIPVGPLQGIPTTAVYTDGVYEGIGNTYDIERVEVLRGPQGTLYGRSATTGVVSTYTVDPVLEHYAANAAVEAGNYSLTHYTGGFNLPLGDTLAVRISANQYKHSGYAAPSGRDAIESSSARAKALFQPNDRFSVLLGFALEANHMGTGGPQAMLTGPNTVTYTPAVILNGLTEQRQYWANLQWDMGWVSLTYIAALRTWYQDAHQYVPFLNNDPLLETNATPTDRFATHELRLASNTGGPLQWLVGTFFYDNPLQGGATYRYPNGVAVTTQSARKQTRDRGVFGEAHYSITPATRLTAGLRYDYTYVQTTETVTQDANLFCNSPTFFLSPPSPDCVPGPPGSPLAGMPVVDVTKSLTAQQGTNRYYNLTYKGRIEQDLSSSNMMYAMISTGFVPGDVQISTGPNNTPQAAPFAQESLTSYELGTKNRFLGNTLQVNADVFYYRYGAYQTTLFVNPANPASATTFAIPARALGAELDVDYLLTASDRIRLGYGYTDAYFVDETPTFRAAYVQSHFVHVPPHTLNLAYDHDFSLPNGSRLDAHTDARLLSTTEVFVLNSAEYAAGMEPFAHAKSAVIGDLGVTWTSASSKYSVTGYMRNVGNNRYKTSILINSVSPLNVPVTLYTPRTFGIILNASL